jgi:hypothetical protein
MTHPKTTAVRELIHMYVDATLRATEQLRRELHAEDLLSAVHRHEVPRVGELSDGTTFRFHGVGCLLQRDGVTLDFDFGPGGRADGFDAWRLSVFAQGRAADRTLHDESTIAEALDELERGGIIERAQLAPSPHLFYLVSED